jgi:exopolysaccharide biosynthesis polyprenyl glycosylphosphotransferase
MAGTPALTLSLRGHHRPWKLAVKRCIDIAVASLLLVLTLPIWLLAMLAIKLDSDGPVFFRQQRSGRLGRPFWFYKFRTMRVDAEAAMSELRGRNEQSGPVFKIRDDPRVTRVGRWLRRYSIDELPQLLHVMTGDMSVVGPRPPLPAEVLQYEIDHRARLSMRPGITCLWQVSGRNEIAFGDWVKLDLEYIERWSLWLDLEIMLLTIPAVLSGRGAS